MVNLLQILWNGLVVGSLFGIAALGLTLLYGILKFINISYAEYLTAGAYVGWVLNDQMGMHILVATALGALVGAVVALATSLVVFQHFRRRSAVTLFIVSVGVSFIIRNIIVISWGVDTRVFFIGATAAPRVFGISLLPTQVAIIILSGLVFSGVYGLLKLSDIGIAMRALADDTDLARVRGIQTDRIIRYVWLLSGLLAGLAGMMIAVDSQITPTLGLSVLIPIFAAVFLGGIGQPKGAIIGGYTVGLVQELSTIVIPTAYKPAIGFVLLISVLLLKPEGLFTDL